MGLGSWLSIRKWPHGAKLPVMAQKLPAMSGPAVGDLDPHWWLGSDMDMVVWGGGNRDRRVKEGRQSMSGGVNQGNKLEDLEMLSLRPPWHFHSTWCVPGRCQIPSPRPVISPCPSPCSVLCGVSFWG